MDYYQNYHQQQNVLGPILIAFTVVLLIMLIVSLVGYKYYDEFSEVVQTIKPKLTKITIPKSKTIIKKKVEQPVKQ